MASQQGSTEEPRFVYEHFNTTVDNVQAMLAEHGVAVIPNVLNKDEIDSMRGGMWKLLAHLSQNLKTPITEDPSTWKSFQELRPLRQCMLHSFGVGQSQVAWDIRQNPAVCEVFARIWNCSPADLLTSFDGLTIHFPPELVDEAAKTSADTAGDVDPKKEPKKEESKEEEPKKEEPKPAGMTLDDYRKDWLHVDQSYARPRFECVQGLVSAFDIEPGDGTLAVLHGSHKHFADFAKEFEVSANTGDWYALRPHQRDFYDARGCKRVSVLCSAGSLVLWDSRTVHCGSLAQKWREHPKIRFVSYVCQVPRNHFSGELQQALQRKRECFAERGTASHWPDNRVEFNDSPFSAREIEAGTAPMVPPMPEPVLTPLGRRIAGLDGDAPATAVSSCVCL